MENFCIVYNHHVDDYFDPFFSDSYEVKKIEGIVFDSSVEFDDKAFLDGVSNIKKIIMQDFRRVLENIICLKNNSDTLVEEIERLLVTYDNDVDYSVDFFTNFIVLTDHYLYFNNMEDVIDEALFGVFGEDSETHCTTVIVDRSFSNFFFIHTTTNIFDESKKTNIKSFVVSKDEMIQSFMAACSEDFSDCDYSEEGIQKVIKTVSNIHNLD